MFRYHPNVPSYLLSGLLGRLPGHSGAMSGEIQVVAKPSFTKRQGTLIVVPDREALCKALALGGGLLLLLSFALHLLFNTLSGRK